MQQCGALPATFHCPHLPPWFDSCQHQSLIAGLPCAAHWKQASRQRREADWQPLPRLDWRFKNAAPRSTKEPMPLDVGPSLSSFSACEATDRYLLACSTFWRVLCWFPHRLHACSCAEFVFFVCQRHTCRSGAPGQFLSECGNVALRPRCCALVAGLNRKLQSRFCFSSSAVLIWVASASRAACTAGGTSASLAHQGSASKPPADHLRRLALRLDRYRVKPCLCLFLRLCRFASQCGKRWRPACG